MDEEIERLIVSVRADTQGFARDVDMMRRTLEGPFADGVGRAGRSLETTLSRAIRTGKLGFEDLEQVARGALDSIAASAIDAGIDGLFGGGGGLTLRRDVWTPGCIRVGAGGRGTKWAIC